jgi:hypothetical protein
LCVRVRRHRRGQQPAAEQIDHGGQIQGALGCEDSGNVPTPLGVWPVRGENPAQQIGKPQGESARAQGPPRFSFAEATVSPIRRS